MSSNGVSSVHFNTSVVYLFKTTFSIRRFGKGCEGSKQRQEDAILLWCEDIKRLFIITKSALFYERDQSMRWSEKWGTAYGKALKRCTQGARGMPLCPEAINGAPSPTPRCNAPWRNQYTPWRVYRGAYVSCILDLRCAPVSRRPARGPRLLPNVIC